MRRAASGFAKKHPAYEAQPACHLLIWNEVEYKKLPSHIDGNVHTLEMIVTNEDRYMNDVFCKPAFFEPEREFRIAVRMTAPSDAKELLLTSPKFITSIVQKSW